MNIDSDVKKISPFIRNPLVKKTLVPEEVNDNNLSLDNFIERVLDHCHYSEIKDISNEDGKKMRFKKPAECKIKYVNFNKFDNLTFKNFEKNRNIETYTKSDFKIKKERIVKIQKASNKDNEIHKTSLDLSISMSWSNNYDLLTGSVSLSEGHKNGKIIVEIPKKNQCVGNIAISKKKGTWAVSCDNNLETASGTLVVKDSILKGRGKDQRGNTVKFISQKF